MTEPMPDFLTRLTALLATAKSTSSKTDDTLDYFLLTHAEAMWEVIKAAEDIVKASELIHDEFHGRWPKRNSMGGKGIVFPCQMCNALLAYHAARKGLDDA